MDPHSRRAAIFSVVDAVLLRPLPFRDSESLVSVHRTYPQWRNDDILRADWDRISCSYPKFREWRDAQTSFTDAGAWANWFATIGGGDRPELLSGMRVSPSLLPLLGIQPVLGRVFLPEEALASAPRLALISFETWVSRFGGDRAVIGRTMQLDETPYTIIGVLPPRTNLTGRGDPPAVWIAAGVQGSDQSANNNQFRVVGRLKPDVSLRRAEFETERLVRGDEDPAKLGARVAPWQREQTKAARKPLLILLGAAGLLLVIACGNVAMLLLGESAARVLLTAAGVRAPHTKEPFTEAMLYGIAGGIGVCVFSFLYASLDTLVRGGLEACRDGLLGANGIGNAKTNFQSRGVPRMGKSPARLTRQGKLGAGVHAGRAPVARTDVHQRVHRALRDRRRPVAATVRRVSRSGGRCVRQQADECARRAVRRPRGPVERARRRRAPR